MWHTCGTGYNAQKYRYKSNSRWKTRAGRRLPALPQSYCADKNTCLDKKVYCAL